MTRSIEVIARAVIILDRRVVLARRKGAAYTFLPGGHIEFGEPAETALARELEEELGVSVVIGRFLGAVENGWTDAIGAFHELNLVFAANIRDLTSGGAIPSKEPHLEFVWAWMHQLDRQILMPPILTTLIPEWIEFGPTPCWASTLENS